MEKKKKQPDGLKRRFVQTTLSFAKKPFVGPQRPSTPLLSRTISGEARKVEEFETAERHVQIFLPQRTQSDEPASSGSDTDIEDRVVNLNSEATSSTKTGLGPIEVDLRSLLAASDVDQYEHVDMTQRPTGESSHDGWDSNHVRMPFSRKNVMQDGNGPSFAKWDVIQSVLRCRSNSFQDLKEAIFAYNPTFRRKWDMAGLGDYLHESPNRSLIFSDILPGMANLALRLPALLPGPLPLLQRGHHKAITLTQMQSASLLANAFFCTFPRRNDRHRSAEYGQFPSINFNTLFSGTKDGQCSSRKKAKLDALFHYFYEVLLRFRDGHITFHRQHRPGEFPNWHASTGSLTDLSISTDGTIEDEGGGLLQVDFANKLIGGGVLGNGCVQEEIRFVINPELLVSRLFIEKLHDSEAVIITGAERFSNYTGYSDTFTWSGPFQDPTPRDSSNRIMTEIVAIDALCFTTQTARETEQYQKRAVLRELNKAFVGFLPSPSSPFETPPGIATGNWGCGAFGGDPELKAMIQIMAASVLSRPILYFTFGNNVLGDALRIIHGALKENNITTGDYSIPSYPRI
ncbi:hypothetical protein DFJ77DRAFT_47977 [Powellomyces hirtus]|nr:hypothetical protein DFJ77DRAFT_47977 [Powellomyces hirtus]